jgi:hypothetical protein
MCRKGFAGDGGEDRYDAALMTGADVLSKPFKIVYILASLRIE